jgi:hypothetical protein
MMNACVDGWSTSAVVMKSSLRIIVASNLVREMQGWSVVGLKYDTYVF